MQIPNNLMKKILIIIFTKLYFFQFYLCSSINSRIAALSHFLERLVLLLFVLYRQISQSLVFLTNIFSLYCKTRSQLISSLDSKSYSTFKLLTIHYGNVNNSYRFGNLSSISFTYFGSRIRYFSTTPHHRQSSDPKNSKKNISSIQTMIQKIKSKIDINSIILGFKKANSISLLPKKIELFYQHIFVRILRFIGGLCLLIVLTKNHLLFHIYLQIPIIILGFLQSVQILIIFIIKIIYGFNTLKHRKKRI